MIVAISSLVLILFVLYKVFKDELTPIRKIPEVEGSIPIFGVMFKLLREKNHVKLVQDWSEKHGPIFRYHRGFGRTRVVLSGPEFIKHVLVSNAMDYEKTGFLKTLLPSLGNGLFSSVGKDHARQRRTINPAFHYSNLADMVADFKDVACNLVKLWSEQVETSVGGVLEAPVHKDLNHMSLDIIGRCAFGYNFNTVLSGDSDVSNDFSIVMRGVEFGRIVKQAIIPLYSYLPFSENTEYKNALDSTDRTVLKVIGEKRQRKEQGIVSSRRDLLDLLLDLRDDATGAAMDDEQLRAQVFTFMLAGHETTSVSMAWTLYELARHPDIAQQIRDEVRTVFKDSSELTWSKLAEMEFLGNVIKESLRLHPPAAAIFRLAKKRDVLGGYEIPKGTLVAIGIHCVQNSPKVWKDPHVFNPHRFDKNGENHGTVHPYAFVPFSAGPRSCIGNKFAMAEMKVVLATLVQRFTFEEVPGFSVAPVLQLTAKPDPPLKLRVRKVVT